MEGAGPARGIGELGGVLGSRSYPGGLHVLFFIYIFGSEFAFLHVASSGRPSYFFFNLQFIFCESKKQFRGLGVSPEIFVLLFQHLHTIFLSIFLQK